MDVAVLLRGYFPFEDVISGDISLATAGLYDCVKHGRIRRSTSASSSSKLLRPVFEPVYVLKYP
jgi:hypothetical protein